MSRNFKYFPFWSELWGSDKPSGPQTVWDHVRDAVCDMQSKLQDEEVTGAQHHSEFQTLSQLFQRLHENHISNQLEAVVFLEKLITGEKEESRSMLLASIYSNHSSSPRSSESSILHGLQRSLCEPSQPLVKVHMYLILQHLVFNAVRTASSCTQSKLWIASLRSITESEYPVSGVLGDACKFAGLEQTLSPPSTKEWLDQDDSSGKSKPQRSHITWFLRESAFSTNETSNTLKNESTGADILAWLLCQTFLRFPHFAPCDDDVDWLERIATGNKTKKHLNTERLTSKVKINRKMLVALLCMAVRSGNVRIQVKVLKLVNITAIFNNDVIMDMCTVPGLVPILVSLFAENQDITSITFANKQDVEAEHKLIAERYRNLIMLFSALTRIGARILVGSANVSDLTQRAKAQISILMLIYVTTRSAYNGVFAWKLQGSILRAMVCNLVSSSSMWCSLQSSEQYIHFTATAMAVEQFVQNIHLRRQRLLENSDDEQIANLNRPRSKVVSKLSNHEDSLKSTLQPPKDCFNTHGLIPAATSGPLPKFAAATCSRVGGCSSSTLTNDSGKNPNTVCNCSQNDDDSSSLNNNNIVVSQQLSECSLFHVNDKLSRMGLPVKQCVQRPQLGLKEENTSSNATFEMKKETVDGTQHATARESYDLLHSFSFIQVPQAAVELLENAAKHDICSNRDLLHCEDSLEVPADETYNAPSKRYRSCSFVNPVRVLSTADDQQEKEMLKTKWTEQFGSNSCEKLLLNYQNLCDTSSTSDSPYASCWLDSIRVRRRTSFSMVETILEGLKTPKSLGVSKLSKKLSKFSSPTHSSGRKSAIEIDCSEKRLRSNSCFEFSQAGNMDADLDFLLACCLQVFRLCNIRGNLQRDVEYHTSQSKSDCIKMIKLNSTLSNNLAILRHAIPNGMVTPSTPRKALEIVPLAPLFPSFDVAAYQTLEEQKLPYSVNKRRVSVFRRKLLPPQMFSQAKMRIQSG